MDANGGEERIIVVGVDGSAGAERALRWAVPEAVRTGASLRLVNVWTVPASAWPITVGSGYLDPADLEDGARHVVQRAASFLRRTFGDAVPPIEEVVHEGLAAPGLLAASRGAAMLVVGTRGRGGFASLVLGSTAAACAHHTAVPLVVVGPEAAPVGADDVVVGFDGSPGSRAALRWAGTEAVRRGSTLRVVHGWDLPLAAPAGAPTFAPLVDPERLPPARRDLELAVAAVLGELPEVPPTRVVVAVASAPEALIRESEEAALLVVGSRGRGGFAALLLGSVSHQCLHHAACPVVVVPSPADRPVGSTPRTVGGHLPGASS